MSDHQVRAVAFDVDGTLVQENFWLQLHDLFGVSREDDVAWMKKYRDGEWNYRQWMDTVSSAYQRNPRSRTEMELIMSSFELFPDAHDVVSKLSARYPVVLISSNIDHYIEAVAATLSVPEWHAYTRFEYDTEGRYAHISYLDKGTELEAKVNSVNAFALRNGLLPSEVAFVGDSKNDLDAFHHTGKGILIRNGNDDLREAAWKRVGVLKDIESILL